MFGFVTSKNFSIKFKFKIISFLKSNLMLDMETLCFSCSFESFIFFLGYRLLILPIKDNFLLNSSANSFV